MTEKSVHDIEINGRLIGPKHPPFIIAEMSANHDGSLEKAFRIAEAAKAAGADALKLQTYTADSMTLNLSKGEFLIDDPDSLWQGYSLYNLYEKAYTPREWHPHLYRHCRKLGLSVFSSPFDESAVDFLETLATPCYKIASFENTHLPLIRRSAATGKPLIISTGMATAKELAETTAVARQAGCRELILLKCTSSYPAPPREANLHTIKDLAERFRCLPGLSDHSSGVTIAAAAVAAGAVVIEKHFTLSRAEGGLDAAFSLEPHELKELVSTCWTVHEAMGTVHYGPLPGEKTSVKHRRSLYITADMKQGEEFTARNLRIIRPGSGLPPLFYDKVLGKKITRDTPAGTPLSRELIG